LGWGGNVDGGVVVVVVVVVVVGGGVEFRWSIRDHYKIQYLVSKRKKLPLL
jgi:hypothetical protein